MGSACIILTAACCWCSWRSAACIPKCHCTGPGCCLGSGSAADSGKRDELLNPKTLPDQHRGLTPCCCRPSSTHNSSISKFYATKRPHMQLKQLAAILVLAVCPRHLSVLINKHDLSSIIPTPTICTDSYSIVAVMPLLLPCLLIRLPGVPWTPLQLHRQQRSRSKLQPCKWPGLCTAPPEEAQAVLVL